MAKKDPEEEIVEKGAVEKISPDTSSSKAIAPADPLAAYMAEVKKYPLLTREEEYELAVKYQETKDPEAAQALVTANLRFVVKVGRGVFQVWKQDD